jgi:hypothetical protein
MFQGNLINQLIATVERAEERAYQEIEDQNVRLALFYAEAQLELAQLGTSYVGAA